MVINGVKSLWRLLKFCLLNGAVSRGIQFKSRNYYTGLDQFSLVDAAIG